MLFIPHSSSSTNTLTHLPLPSFNLVPDTPLLPSFTHLPIRTWHTHVPIATRALFPSYLTRPFSSPPRPPQVASFRLPEGQDLFFSARDPPPLLFKVGDTDSHRCICKPSSLIPCLAFSSSSCRCTCLVCLFLCSSVCLVVCFLACVSSYVFVSLYASVMVPFDNCYTIRIFYFILFKGFTIQKLPIFFVLTDTRKLFVKVAMYSVFRQAEVIKQLKVLERKLVLRVMKILCEWLMCSITQATSIHVYTTHAW